MDEDILSTVVISSISSPLLVIYVYNNAHLWL